MRSSFARVIRRSVRSVQNIVGQVVVSVAAAVCVGFITNAYLERQPASGETGKIVAAQQADLPAANSAAATLSMTEDSTPVPASTGPQRPLQPASASPIRNVMEAPMPVERQPVAEVTASLPPLDSETVTNLRVRDIDTAANGAEIFPGVPAEDALAEFLRNPPAAEQKPERRRFLGLPLPYFVPTPGEVVQSASAAGGKIISVVAGR